MERSIDHLVVMASHVKVKAQNRFIFLKVLPHKECNADISFFFLKLDLEHGCMKLHSSNEGQFHSLI